MTKHPTSLFRLAVQAILLLALLADMAFSFNQFYTAPMDGDMADNIVPAPAVAPVLTHPLGIPAMTGELSYVGTNRFFAHWSQYQYFNRVPLLLQHFTTPLNSAYLSCAIAKILMQMMLIVLLGIYVTGSLRLLSLRNLFAYCLMAPLFQAYGYEAVKVIDPAPTYCFFYALPMAVMLLYLLPLYLELRRGSRPSWWQWGRWLWLLLVPLCALGGPLGPGVSLTLAAVLFAAWLMPRRDSGKTMQQRRSLGAMLRQIPSSGYILVLPLVAGSLYSLFVGSFNTHNSGEIPSVWQRYALLPTGVWQYMTSQIGFLAMAIALIVNMALMRRWNIAARRQMGRETLWLLLFSLLYFLLLPLGGYRNYRPNIIRYDTAIPVTLCLMYLYGRSTWLLTASLLGRKGNLFGRKGNLFGRKGNLFNRRGNLLGQRENLFGRKGKETSPLPLSSQPLSGNAPIDRTTSKARYAYLLLPLLIAFIYTNEDDKMADNSKEIAAIRLLQRVPETMVALPHDALVVSWRNIETPEDSKLQAQLLLRWHVTTTEKRFYNLPKEAQTD